MENFNYPQGERNVVNLGKVLFYDKTLSINNSIACGSCHIQSKAFSDNQTFSNGFEFVQTSRNSPGFQNLRQNIFFEGKDSINGTPLFWDGRESNLQNMVTKPIFNHIEMGIKDLDALEERVKKKSYYPQLFQSAFNSETITAQKISMALSSFVGAIESNNSRFDRGNLNAIELEGLKLFIDTYDCSACHHITPFGYNDNPPLASEPFSNIGLDANPNDLGRGAITGKSNDNGKFKIPNLRNVELTAPYMHDGRLKTLEEVLDHYDIGIKNAPTLDPRLKNGDGSAKKFNISVEHKKAIVAFLKTLTDQNFVTAKMYSNPFIKK